MSGGEDELDRLRRALAEARPRPVPGAGAAALRRALEEFDDLHQGTAEEPRSKPDRPRRRDLLGGLRDMLDRMTTKWVLGTGASLATFGLAAVLVTSPDQGRQIWGGSGPQPDVQSDAPVSGQPAPRSNAAAGPSPQGGSGPAAQPAPAMTEAVPATQAPAPARAPGALAKAAPPMAEALQAPQAAPAMPMEDTQFRVPQTRMGVAPPQTTAPQELTRDTFAEFQPQSLQITAETPVSTFSVDVDTAAWSWLRGSLRAGQRPDPAAIRLEEMVNYFPYDYGAPAPGGAPFAASIAQFETPWNPDTRLVRIGLQGALPALAERPPLDLVFLIDTSGSMQGPDRLGLLKTAFGMLLGSLTAQDKVAIVSYAGHAGEVLAPTSAAERDTILAALSRLEAGGGTAGGAGLEQAYATAAAMAAEGRVSRVVLATDGDFNLGPQSPEALKALVAEKRGQGTYLSVLGFGRGNFDDALMQALAQNGNGQAAYIDSAEEARKVLVDQAAGALFPIADDVKIQVEWNPAVVAEYRLLGYETRALAREDFANDKVDAGEIGAGHQVTALYEITPVGSPARRVEPLRYGAANAPQARAEAGAGAAPGDAAEAGWLRLRYKAPGAAQSQLIEAPIPAQAGEADPEARFAAAIAGFAQLLSGGKYLGDWSYPEAIALAEGARGEDRFGYRAEAISLMRTAAALPK